MKRLMKLVNLCNDESGQSMADWELVVSIVTIAVILILTFLGTSVLGLFVAFVNTW